MQLDNCESTFKKKLQPNMISWIVIIFFSCGAKTLKNIWKEAKRGQWTVQIQRSAWTKTHLPQYGNTVCGVFKGGIQNQKGFWLKINCCQMKLLNFANWHQKVPKFDFQNQFFMSKIIWIFLNSFSMKNTNLGAHF